MIGRLWFSIFIVTILAATAIAQSGPTDWPQIQVRLEQALSSGNSEQKRTALAEIRNLRTEQASRLAIPALADKDQIVRATAASAVIYLPESEAARSVLPLLDDKMRFVRREAASALGQIGSWSARRKLISILEKDRDREVRSAAAVALGNIGDYAALDALIQILNKKPTDDEEFLRRSAARSIGQVFELYAVGTTYTVTPQNFLPPKFKDADTRKDLTRLSGEIDIDLIVKALAQVLQNSREAADTRREAAFALGAIRQPAAASILSSYSDNSDPYLAEIVREALQKIGPKRPDQ